MIDKSQNDTTILINPGIMLYMYIYRADCGRSSLSPQISRQESIHLDPLCHSNVQQSTPVPLEGISIALGFPLSVQCVEQPACQGLGTAESNVEL